MTSLTNTIRNDVLHTLELVEARMRHLAEGDGNDLPQFDASVLLETIAGRLDRLQYFLFLGEVLEPNAAYYRDPATGDVFASTRVESACIRIEFDEYCRTKQTYWSVELEREGKINPRIDTSLRTALRQAVNAVLDAHIPPLEIVNE